MKNKCVGVITIVLAITFLVSILSVPNSTITGAEKEVINIIKVTGKGSVDIVPDTAHISVGVLEEGVNLESTQDNVTKKMGEITKTVKNLGIKEKDITTTSYNISPKYEWDDKNQSNSVVGYRVNTSLKITVKDVNNVGKIIDKVTESGGNVVSNLRFSVSDDIEMYKRALEIAVKDAEDKALSMGKKYNITKVRPVRIEEINSNNSYTTLNRSAVNSTEQIHPGEAKINANVLVEFSY